MTRAAVGLLGPVASGLAVLGALASTAAEAAPVIEVRARTKITIDPIRRARDAPTSPPMTALRIRGLIQERGTGQPVPYARDLIVALDDQRRITSVGEDGTFESYFTAEGGRHRLTIEYPGDGQFEGSTYSLPDLDVAKQPLVLSLRVPEAVRRSRGPLEVEVQASGETDPAEVQIAVAIGAAEAEQLAALGEVTTSDLGRGPITIPVERLGAPGPKRLRARFAGDDVYDPATIETTFQVASDTHVGFEMDLTEVRFEGRVRGRGRLTDDLGHGLAGQPVALLADLPDGRRSVDESLTDRDGSFSLDAAASELGPGTHMVQAVFESPRAYLGGSRSQPSRIAVAERRPVPVAYSLTAFAATAASMVAFILLRTRPWTRWLVRLRGESAGPGAGGEKASTPHTGLTLARPGLVSTLRRPHDRGFTGAVADAVTGNPIAGATVELRPVGREPASSATTDAAGLFAFEDVPEGEHGAVVSCAGYVAERFNLVIPHRGELRDARVDLLPVRERIFQIYREAAEPLLPRPDLWGVWTPRQIFEHVRSARPARALADLTDYVEEKYFSARTPEEAELTSAAARVAAARAEAAPHLGA